VHFYKSDFEKEVRNYVGFSKIFAVAIKFCFILKQSQTTTFALDTAVCLQTTFLLIQSHSGYTKEINGFWRVRKIVWLFLHLYNFPNLCHNIYRVQVSLVSIYTFHFTACAAAVML
jgi:hypothetical protein